jgi:polyisoprenyl-teichoic acid--peptidoglycan teichoic acid transferase
MGRGRREWLLVRAPDVSEARVDVGPAPLRIGRGPGNQVVLRDNHVSATHAELVDREGERCVRDLGSRNGTRLNGRALEPGALQALRDGDVLRIGSCELTYRRDPPSGRAAARPRPRPDEEDSTRRVSRIGRKQEPPPTHLPAPPPPGRWRGWRGRGRVILWLLVGGLAATGILAGALWALAPPRVALLVLGGDARPDELRRGEQGRTDTVLTVVADRSPAGAVLISIPRDLWVQIPGFGGERINAAYTLGGPQAAKRAVSEVLGVRVDHYLLIGLQGVRDVVDAAGGVEIDVDRPIHDDAYPTDDYGTIVIDIPAGRQRMDGETALRYARTRHQDNDFGRIARQQRLVVALRNALLQPANWWRLPAVIGAVRRATETDLGLLELVTLGVVLIGGPTEPDRLAVDLSLVDELTGSDGAYLLRPRPTLRERVAAVLAPHEAAVEVLNGTRTDGLAKQAADRLRDRGMRIARFGNAARLQAESTVEARPGFRRAGVHAATILDLPRETIRENSGLPEGVDVRVTLGDERGRS